MEMITNIAAGYYQGYIWDSDKMQPKVVDGIFEGLNLPPIPSNPFIIEAQLFNPQSEKSYSIRWVDGHYVALEFDCKALSQECQTEDCFLPGFEGAPGLLRFITVWREDEGDPLCEGMRVFKANENIFMGFKTKSK